MANIHLRRQVLELRKLGKSYSQIKNELGVSKSTLSDWLKKYPLSSEQIYKLSHNEVRIEKYWDTMRIKRETRWLRYYKEAQKTMLPLTKKELSLAGLFLYWGEGGKTLRGQVSVSNTDPSVLKFSLYWMIEALAIPKERIQVALHLYDDMEISQEIEFWSNKLSIPKDQFAKPYVKKSKRIDIDQKGFGHGTCHLRVNDTVIKEKILMSIKAMAEYSNQYISRF